MANVVTANSGSSANVSSDVNMHYYTYLLHAAQQQRQKEQQQEHHKQMMAAMAMVCHSVVFDNFMPHHDNSFVFFHVSTPKWKQIVQSLIFVINTQD
jgi:hypothetical protein